jgi:Family of unknown function (DUF6600)
MPDSSLELQEIMRNLAPRLVLALAVTLTVCCGYDRKLLGDPAPVPVAEVVDESLIDQGYEPEAAPDSLEMFDDLAFYGSWYELQPFGMVWRPTVVLGWRPLQDGYWAYTEYGWMWVSQDPFGWATYHYGYWVDDFTLGWVWIPDYQWTPCQCDWIVMGDYVCWSPVPPPGQYYRDPWNGGEDDWMVVPAAKFRETEVARYKTPPAKFKSAYKTADVSRSAPEPRYVEKFTRSSIETVPVELKRQPYGAHELTRVVVRGAPVSGGSGFKTGPPSMGAPLTTPATGSGNTGTNPPAPKKTETKKESTPRKFKSKDSKGGSDAKDSGTSKDKKDDSGQSGGAKKKKKG